MYMFTSALENTTSANKLKRKRKKENMRISKYYEVWNDEAVDVKQTDDFGVSQENCTMTPHEFARELNSGGRVQASMHFWCWKTIMEKRVHFFETYVEADYYTGEKTYFSWFVHEITPDEAKELARLMDRPHA